MRQVFFIVIGVLINSYLFAQETLQSASDRGHTIITNRTGHLGAYKGALRTVGSGSDNWAMLSMPDSVYETGSQSYWLIGRGASYSDRTMSFHIPSYGDYGNSGNVPHFKFAKTGDIPLFTLDADGKGYISGRLGIGITPAVSLHVNGKGTMEDNLKIFASGESWADGLTIVRPTGWSGIRFARNDPARGVFDGNWAIGYTGNTGNDLSISNQYGNQQYDYVFHINSATRNIGIGTSSPTEKLSVNGRIRALEIKVETANWPDYVFEEGYLVRSLESLEDFIKENRHLPKIPLEAEVREEGIALGEMNKMLLKKIEELTLYLIEQNKRITKQSNKLELVEMELKRLTQEKGNN